MKIAVIIPNYNSAELLRKAVTAMLRQSLFSSHTMDVVVVDDGSTDGSADILERDFGELITLIRLPENRGRSSARNAGAAATGADILVFVDSDCIPADETFVAAHVETLEIGSDVSFGQVCTPGDGFWDQLQEDAAAWRLRRFNSGDTWTFTTQNVAVRRRCFDRAGGFDPTFNRHGFEDRDLFVRLANAGALVRYTPTAQVIHEDQVNLASVARKLGEAGYHAAHLFRAKHPAIYREMTFSRLDSQINPWLVVADAILWPFAKPLARGPAGWLEWRVLPFRLRAFLARALYGLSFLHGTVLRRAERKASS